jgi:glycosyltransferase involved in cell wall biosynthesis
MQRPKTVLLVDHTSIIGGAEISMESLILFQEASEFSFSVALPAEGPLSDRLRAQDIHVQIVPLESWRWWIGRPIHALKLLVLLPRQVRLVLNWVSFLKTEAPDLVHLNINRLVEPVIAAKILGIPSVIHFRDIPSRIPQKFAGGTRGFYGLMNLADAWIANSIASAKDVEPHAKTPLFTIPNGVDLASFDRDSLGGSSLPDRDFEFTVVMVAGLVPWKNHSGFVQVARMISERRDDVGFLIAGEGDEIYKAELERQVVELGLEGRVRLVGHTDNVPALLASSDVMVHTTDREPFGRVFIEAMAARLPVLAWANGGAKEIVVHCETGMLFASQDLAAMAEGLDNLLDDPETRRQMGEAGRKRVVARYTQDRHCEAVNSVYRTLLRTEDTPLPEVT